MDAHSVRYAYDEYVRLADESNVLRVDVLAAAWSATCVGVPPRTPTSRSSAARRRSTLAEEGELARLEAIGATLDVRELYDGAPPPG